ncbi:MAG TPA: ANTAR domain-containing protein [Candidatus Methylomirabilis sp.]|nr:ANTAR domain-containing protein [Candidatus Methylomirabilis sp.]
MRKRILLMTDHGDHAKPLEWALVAARHVIVAIIRSDDDLCFYAWQARPDAVVVALTALDHGLLQQLERLSREQPLPVVVFVDRTEQEALRAAVKAGVSSYVVDGLEIARVVPVFEAALARFREFQILREQRDAAVARLSERKRIERAKSVLMERRGLSEKAAHAALRQMADAAGKRASEMAQQILAVEALLHGQAQPDGPGARATTVSTDPAKLMKASRAK